MPLEGDAVDVARRGRPEPLRRGPVGPVLGKSMGGGVSGSVVDILAEVGVDVAPVIIFTPMQQWPRLSWLTLTPVHRWL